MRRNLLAVLESFVAAHGGLRMGRVFGAPAGFAGRRVFARLSEAGLELRLPPSIREPEASGLPSGVSHEVFRGARAPRHSARRGRAVSSDWLTITQNSPAGARVEILLEQAARYVALA